MANEDYPRSVRIALEDIAQWENERAELERKIQRARDYVRAQMEGTPLPSPTSTASRVIVCIKAYLDNGPATFEKILSYLLEQQNLGKVVIKGDASATVKRSLSKSVTAGTILHDGEMYRLP